MKAIIFCNGKTDNYNFLKSYNYENCLIICADGGVEHAKAVGVIPDVVIGDEDSTTFDVPSETKIIKYPTDKDYTDTQLCIDYAIEHNCNEIVLLCASGGRLDHEYSHYCLLAYGLKNNVKIKIVDEYNEVWMEDKPFCINKSDKKYVSFFAYGGDVEGFTVNGLKYSAIGIDLSSCAVQASSNEFTDELVADISFNSGKVLVIMSNDGI